MRIALANWSRRRAGGAESYLESLVPELLARGHEVGFWSETDAPEVREQIRLPSSVKTWCGSELGSKGALAGLKKWRPDVINLHGAEGPIEPALSEIAPVVFFAHDYHGTCISEAKAFQYPAPSPCERRFGWECFLHYYPRRCGGWSPVTMVRKYRQQSARLAAIHRHAAVITSSDHMRAEFVRHGLPPHTVHVIPLPIRGGSGRTPSLVRMDHAGVLEPPWQRRMGEGRNLLFLGRMDWTKGGPVLLEAIPSVQEILQHPLQVIFAGDGPDRGVWEDLAARVERTTSDVRIQFVGWVGEAHRDLLLAGCDLLVVPSVWPEPFGLIGLEAGLHGVPVAAFAVGGIPEWLVPGQNGYLAPGDPPAAVGLADAIVRCLRDPATHARLRRGAIQVAQRYSSNNHVSRLLDVFGQVVERRVGTTSLQAATE